MNEPVRFAGLWDLHFGFERKNRHKVPIHDLRALNATLHFLSDFKPDVLIWGGDILDCGGISHHNKGNRRAVEGLRLAEDAKVAASFVRSVRSTLAKGAREILIKGNHERFLEDLIDDFPALEGVLELEALLPLEGVKVLPVGSSFRLGKIRFLHGDQIGGGMYPSRKAVDEYNEPIRFGHFHTYQVFTKNSPVDLRQVRNGIAVPALCKRDPAYGGGAANRWAQGFLWGYLHEDGTFNDYVSIIVNGRFSANGRTYRA